MKEIVEEFEVAIIGGGATGLGVAVEAASRGYKTILLEAYDFGKGTSSKSTKLVHGGIRYLANLDFALVKEGLSERFYFLQNAPHLAQKQTYMIPFYSYWDKIKFILGIFLYDSLAGNKQIGKSQFLNKKETLKQMPNIKTDGLLGSAIYNDGQFDDTRMLISLLRTFQNLGGIAYNYHKVTAIKKNSNNKINGLKIFNKLNDTEYEINCKTVINATGTLVDEILNLDEPNIKHHNVSASQGTHLVFDRDIFTGTHALTIPKTSDNRILFVLPWHTKIIVGTTDILVKNHEIEPKALNDEISFILNTFNKYSIKKVDKNDIKAVFTGQRPLVTTNNNLHTKSAKISRKHELLLSKSNLISIVGGKWTIYRLMGEDTINFAIKQHLLKLSMSVSKDLPLFGYLELKQLKEYPLSVYGSDYNRIIEIQHEIQNYNKLHPGLPYYVAEVIYHVRYEMAKTIEDVLARRTRALFLDAKAAIETAPLVANLIAKELEKNDTWIKTQLLKFNETAKNYII